MCFGAEMSCFSLATVVTWLCLHSGVNQESPSLQITLVQSNHTKLYIAAAEELPVPEAAPVPLQHSPVCHWLWHRSGMASWKPVGEARWFLALPPQLHTPAVRCPSASLESTYPAPGLDPDLTHCPWGLSDHPAVATGFPSCTCCTCSTSFPRRLSQSCYPHLNCHTSCLLPCFAELKLFPELFPRSASKAMTHL